MNAIGRVGGRASAAARLDRLPILPFHRTLLALIGAGIETNGRSLEEIAAKAV